MLEEIHEQPVVLDRTLRSERDAAVEIRKALAVRPPRAIVLVARGTSDNAAQFGRYLLELKTGIPVSLAAPSIITLYGREVNYSDCLVVAISQSGESTDTNLVLESARRQGAVTVGITNEASSSMASIAEHLLLVHAGRERSVAATKTYTGQMMALYLLAWAMGGAGIEMDDLDRLSAHAAAALRTEDEIQRLAERYRFMESTVVLGRGLNYANAFEFSLKLMETCAVVAERFSSADFLHGPIAMVGQQFPVFAFVPGGPTWATMKLMIDKVRETTTETLLVTDESNREASALSKRCVVIPDFIADETLTPIPYIIPAQLLAAHLAEEKGMDADHPRGLTKVTRTL